MGEYSLYRVRESHSWWRHLASPLALREASHAKLQGGRAFSSEEISSAEAKMELLCSRKRGRLSNVVPWWLVGWRGGRKVWTDRSNRTWWTTSGLWHFILTIMGNTEEVCGREQHVWSTFWQDRSGLSRRRPQWGLSRCSSRETRVITVKTEWCLGFTWIAPGKSSKRLDFEVEPGFSGNQIYRAVLKKLKKKKKNQ